MLTPGLQTVDWASLEALDLSLLSQAGGKQTLAEQVRTFINKNGNSPSIPRSTYHTPYTDESEIKASST
jgi:hypothetical protein